MEGIAVMLKRFLQEEKAGKIKTEWKIEKKKTMKSEKKERKIERKKQYFSLKKDKYCEVINKYIFKNSEI